jgi:hypothetical protein
MLVVGDEEKLPCGSEETQDRDAVGDADFQGAWAAIPNNRTIDQMSAAPSYLINSLVLPQLFLTSIDQTYTFELLIS